MKLFEDKFRDNYKRAETNQNVYEYYDTNQQYHIVKIRELLNKWFENYPTSYKTDLKNNFKNHFYNAFYELFVHEIYFCQGYILEPHPEIQGTTRRPDFLATKGQEKIFIEATTVSYLSDLETKKENLKEKFIDELNKMQSPIFWLALKDLKFKTNKFPKVGKLKRAFEQKLAELDPSELEKGIHSIFGYYSLKYSDEEVHIHVNLYPKTDAAKLDPDFRPIGLQFMPVTIQSSDNDANKILKSFKNKAGRYGKLPYPFIICLNLNFQFNLQHDVDWAFYESSMFNSEIPKFTRVSGVLITNISTGNILNLPSHRFILNKHSTFPLNPEIIKLSYETAENQKKELQSINTILNLDGKEKYGIMF
ncbi:hypothetical protein RT99_12860 [Flavobacterium sp. MEB061]|uniref:hypothetical protein n=1 Tax=Flavobacterium sp. MEB061 TaxID=1587524 RepID=UPI0005AD0908|nr:hypothetical protein [Flavobacterium sp. MEB061]KIQ20904.1 hypothetical protein RT99_12860 [Flavobacterium sp. MEB061]